MRSTALSALGLGLLACTQVTPPPPPIREPAPERAPFVWLANPALRTLQQDLPLGPAGPRISVAAGGQLWARVREEPSTDRADAVRRLADAQAQLRGLFTPTVPPYPEFLTRESRCPAAFLPVWEGPPEAPIVTLFASDRHGFGVCDAASAQFRAAVTYRVCDAPWRAVVAEVHGPLAADAAPLRQLLATFRCAAYP